LKIVSCDVPAFRNTEDENSDVLISRIKCSHIYCLFGNPCQSVPFASAARPNLPGQIGSHATHQSG
jgi:hypothetical protein